MFLILMFIYLFIYLCFLHLQSGFDTIYSDNFFSIPVSANMSYTSNVNVTGRWVFRVDKPENDGIIFY